MLKLHKQWHRSIFVTLICLQNLYAFKFPCSACLFIRGMTGESFRIFLLCWKISSHQKCSIVFRLFVVKVKHVFFFFDKAACLCKWKACKLFPLQFRGLQVQLPGTCFPSKDMENIFLEHFLLIQWGHNLTEDLNCCWCLFKLIDCLKTQRVCKRGWSWKLVCLLVVQKCGSVMTSKRQNFKS